MYDLKHFDYEQELDSSQEQLQKIANDILLVLTLLQRLKERLETLETKPRFAGSIWLKQAKYPYAVHPTGKDGKRKREYVGLDGRTALEKRISNHKEYESLKKQFSEQHQIYRGVKYSLGNTSHRLFAKQSEMRL